MALSAQNQNLISEMMNFSEAQLALLDKAHNLLARWNNNDVYNALTDADVTGTFPHLDKSEIVEAINAITAVSNALGDFTSGQAVNLVKMKG